METLEQLRQQLTNDLKNSFLKRASDTDSNRKPLDVIGEVSLMLATNIADYSEKLLREIVTPGYVTDEYDKRYTLLTTFNAHESNLRDAKHITKEQLDVINLVTSWFGFDPDENAVYVKNKYNFYAEGGVSAKGFSAGGSGGGGGMDEELLWSILGDGDNPNKQIALSHLDTLLKNISNTYYTKQQIQANYLTASEISAKYISKDAFPKIFSDEMAKWFKKDEDGNIYAEVNFYSTQGISAKGLGSGSGGGGGMDEELLWAILGDGENPDKQIAISHLSTALSNYATHTWVTDKHYATEAWVTAKKYATIDWVNETFVKKADYTDLWLAEMDKWFKKDDSGNIYTEVNFYSNKGVSAKGLDASGGGGGGMDEELLWSILGDGENPNKQIALTHLTTALSGYYTSTQVNSAINDAVKYYIPTSQKGVAGGVAPLGSDGLISSSFLPSYVDDVLEFASLSAFPSTGESGKIYIAVDTNLTYRWSGTQYVEVSKSLALGETESTAYAGNKGAANRADIDKLKRATFWGASYQSDGNVYGTFTGTKIILSDLIETPKIKIGDAFIEYDAERTALKVVRYLADGTETVASLYATGGISARGFSPSGGGGGGMDEELLWSILGDGENPNKQIALTHLTTALSGYYTSTQVNSAINDAVKYYIPTSQKGVAGGVAPLGSDGLISSSFLPSYVDDVLEFASLSAFPSTGESGKIYIAVDTNLTYRWSGTQYVEVSKSLALGETESTAYAGNKGAANRADIDKLKRATFWGASYQSDGNVYGTFTGTKIILSDLIETPKIKIGDAFIEYDAERTALKVVRYLADGTETVASLYATGGISARGFSPSGGGGDSGADSISLNGTLYGSVDGVITLPNLKLAEPTIFNLNNSNGNVEVRTPGRTGYYEFWDIGSKWASLVGKSFIVSGGTSSQFLKADGSVDGNLYALAYEGNQNKVQYSRHTDHLKTVNRGNQGYTPNIIENYSLSSYFTTQDTPYVSWRSTISVKGWTADFATWELTGPSHNDDTKANERLYYRYGFNSSWKTGWKPLAFLEDISNVADVYFNGQSIYSDYGHWVVGLIRIGTAGIGDEYISGEMIYRRSNGIYGNGSVRFNLIKKYNSTQMHAGVFYTGYGVDPDQDAPRLCTFTYQGVKWGGLCWRSAASLDSIKTIIYDNSFTDTPFYVRYFNSQSSEIQNAEINNSISVLGSDIEVQPVSTNGRFYTSADKIEINNITNGWSYIRYRTNGIFYDVGLSGTIAGMAGTGNFEIRPNGSNNEGVFVRYYQSNYGKLGVVNKSGQQCSISYFNNAPTGDYPLWTVGAGIRNQYSFDWWYHNQGYKMTLDSEGKLFINVKLQGNPSCSLTIGDYDTGLNWHQDGMIIFKSNNKDVGHWGYSDGRLYNTYFREPTGNGYAATSMMVKGNGSNLYPGIGFYQPGVTAGAVYFTNSGEFKFRNIDDTGYTNVYGGHLIADAGYLYSRYNGIEIRIGAENSSYVHFINNQSKQYYFDNGLAISGTTFPYSDNSYDLGTYSTKWRNIYANRLIGEADKSVFLVTNYNYSGERQTNPQTYFNNGIGIKVAMTGSIKYWNDTLWINGYPGSDVPYMCALHTFRDGTPQMYISTQKSDATSYGTMYLFYTSYNANKSDSPWICSTLNAYGRITTASDIYSQSWVRTVGTTGWYSESYGGGWHMTDSTWLRAYNNKQIYTASTSPDAFHTLGGVNASGRIYAGSYIETHGGLVCAGVGNSGGASGFNVYASFYGNGQHGGIEIGASDNVFGIGVHSDDHMYWWWTNSGSVGSSSNKSYIMIYGGGSWSFTGNILATGGITAKTTSDMRLKNKIGNSNYIEKLLSLGPVFDYTYNDIAKSRVGKMVDNEIHTGLSYQNVSKLFPTMCGVDEDGYGYINYISPDFISLIAGAVQTSILNIKDLYNKQKTIYDNLEDALKRIEELEKRLGY